MSAIITPFEGTEPFNTASFNNRISQINTGFSYVSNPNLLDNWYFGRPVNQRGQTEYTSNVYTVDRWWVEHGITLKIANDGVVLESAGTDWWVGLLEKIECSLPARTTITFSVLGKFTGDTRLFLGTSGNDELKSNYFTPSGDWECVSVTATLESATNMLGVRVSPDTGNVKANCTLLAAKLELGPTQTLAHLEGDKWILNEVPDYGEQLRRCQRYCRVYKAGESLPYLAYAESNGWYLSASMYIGNMRTTPINNFGSGLSCSVINIDGDTSFDKTIMNWGIVGSTIQRLRISGGDKTPGPFPYNVMPKQDLIFSADL